MIAWATAVFVGVLAVTVVVVFALPEYAVAVTGGGVLASVRIPFDANQTQTHIVTVAVVQYESISVLVEAVYVLYTEAI